MKIIMRKFLGIVSVVTVLAGCNVTRAMERDGEKKGSASAKAPFEKKSSIEQKIEGLEQGERTLSDDGFFDQTIDLIILMEGTPTSVWESTTYSFWSTTENNILHLISKSCYNSYINNDKSSERFAQLADLVTIVRHSSSFHWEEMLKKKNSQGYAPLEFFDSLFGGQDLSVLPSELQVMRYELGAAQNHQQDQEQDLEQEQQKQEQQQQEQQKQEQQQQEQQQQERQQQEQQQHDEVNVNNNKLASTDSFFSSTYSRVVLATGLIGIMVCGSLYLMMGNANEAESTQ